MGLGPRINPRPPSSAPLREHQITRLMSEHYGRGHRYPPSFAKVIFRPVIPDLRNSTDFLKVSQTPPACPSDNGK